MLLYLRRHFFSDYTVLVHVRSSQPGATNAHLGLCHDVFTDQFIFIIISQHVSRELMKADRSVYEPIQKGK